MIKIEYVDGTSGEINAEKICYIAEREIFEISKELMVIAYVPREFVKCILVEKD